MGDEVGDGLTTGVRSTQLVDALLLGGNERHDAIGGRRLVGGRHRDLGAFDHGGCTRIHRPAGGQDDNSSGAYEQTQSVALRGYQVHEWPFHWFKSAVRITGWTCPIWSADQ